MAKSWLRKNQSERSDLLCHNNKSQYFGEESTSVLAVFSCGSSILVEMKFRMLVFVEGEKPKYAEKKPLEQGENHHWAILTPADLILH